MLAAATWIAALAATALPVDNSDGASVLVTTAAFEPGEAVGEAVTDVTVPTGLVPDDALVVVDPRAVAARSVGVNEILTAADVATGAALAAGEAAVVIPAGPTLSAVVAGESVFVIVGADPFAGTDAAVVPGRALTIRTDGVLVAIEQRSAIRLPCCSRSAKSLFLRYLLSLRLLNLADPPGSATYGK